MALDPSILIFGHDATLLDTRRWVLETARFRVVSNSELADVLAAVEQQSPDLILLCHTLTRDERNTVLAAAAVSQPPVRTLFFRPTRQLPGEEKIPGDILDRFVGAAGLIAAVQRLLG